MNLLKDFDGSQDKSGQKLLLDFYGGIGDLLWRTCLVRELKKRNQGLYLGVMSRGPHWKLIFRDNPYVDELVDEQPNKEFQGDWSLYCSDSLCPHVVADYGKTMHCVDAIGYWAGIEITDKSYDYEVTEDERKWAREFLSKFKPKTIVGFGIKGSSWVRRWDPLQVLRLTKLLCHNDYHVILFDDRPIPWTHKNLSLMAGGYNVRELAAIIESVDYVITCDTGSMHFAGAFRKPTIAIFCGTSPELRSSHYPTVYAMVPNKEKYPCWPCFQHAASCGKGLPVPCAMYWKAEDVFLKLIEVENAELRKSKIKV